MSTTGTYSSRYETLDHWRGIAALMVVVFHASARYRVSAGDPGAVTATIGLFWLGVQLFFVISGYCIAAAVESSYRRNNRRILEYFTRRVRRIFPTYLFWLVILISVMGLLEVFVPQLLGRDSYRLSKLTAVNWLGNISLTETWLPRLVGQRGLVLTRVGWTLCYELQFYLVCMVLMLLPRKWFYHGIAVTTAVVFCVFVFEGPVGVRWKFIGTFLDGRWLQFAMGIWVFYALTQGKMSTRILSGVFFLFVSVTSFQFLGDYSLGDAIDLRTKRILELSVCSAFSVLLLLIRTYDKKIGDSKLLKPLQKTGVMSYSLYLVHWPICKVLAQLGWGLGLRSLSHTVLITTPICLFASMLVTYYFFTLFEKPFISSSVPRSDLK